MERSEHDREAATARLLLPFFGGNSSAAVVFLDRQLARSADVVQILIQARASLDPGGRIAVLLPNRSYEKATTLRELVRKGRTDNRGKDSGLIATPRLSLSTVSKAMKNIGLVNIKAWSVSPSIDKPWNLRPLDRGLGYISAAPAFMLMGNAANTTSKSLLEQVQEQLDGSLEGAKGSAPRSKIKSVRISPEGKALVFMRYRRNGIWVRLPYSRATRSDERNGYAVLSKLQVNERIIRQVPRPLLAGIIDDHPYYAESQVEGMSLARCINSRDRPVLLRDAMTFLRNLNPRLGEKAPTPLIGGVWRTVVQSMLDPVLQHVPAGMRANVQELFNKTLHGAASRMGMVHGDFSANNILVARGRITGVIDWEDARAAGPPVLDAFNYIDSVHRNIGNLTVTHTMPLLMAGGCLAEEEEFLHAFFKYCGIDTKFRKGFALLYFIYHVGPKLRFAERREAFRGILQEVFHRSMRSS